MSYASYQPYHRRTFRRSYYNQGQMLPPPPPPPVIPFRKDAGPNAEYGNGVYANIEFYKPGVNEGTYAECKF